jgi:hypothetical protein
MPAIRRFAGTFREDHGVVRAGTALDAAAPLT